MPTISLPGLIDMHVHLREPGLTQKGDMETETRAALAGGVTTVCDMPNTDPPTVTVNALRDKVERAKRFKDCDIRFYFGVTAPEHLEELRRLCTNNELVDLRASCCGVKLYLDHSTGNQKIDPALVGDVLRFCKEQHLVVVAHCEDPEINANAADRLMKEADVSAHSRRRPPESEEKAVSFLLEQSRKTGAHVHPTHISTKRALALIRKAKKDGINVTCDVTPHHLFLTVEDYPALGTMGKMNPPLRSVEDRDALWKGIADGTVDCIATDHAPHTVEEKSGEPLKAPGGVPGVETMLPLLLTVLSGQWPHPMSPKPAKAVLTVDDIRRLCFENPNRILSLGKDGNSTIKIKPGEEWEIHAEGLHSKCKWTPYENWKVRGKVKM